jgi:large subunit ribosomal protein L35
VPKIKTRRGAAKRFKKTASGRLKRGKAFRSHNLSHMSSKQKRNLRNGALVSKADEPRINALIPYA